MKQEINHRGPLKCSSQIFVCNDVMAKLEQDDIMIEWQKSALQSVTSWCPRAMSLELMHTVMLCCTWNSLKSSLSLLPPLSPLLPYSSPPLIPFYAHLSPLFSVLHSFPSLTGQYSSKLFSSLCLSHPLLLSLFLSCLSPSGRGGGGCKVGGLEHPHSRLFARLICGGSGLRRTSYCMQWKSLTD